MNQVATLSLGKPPGASGSAMVFLRLRWKLLCNSWRVLFGHSRIRPFTIALCSAIICTFVFLISWEGFRFMSVQGMALGGNVIGMLFDLMFLALGGLLIFSSGLILYSSLFASQETAFLLSSPMPDDQIFAFKFQGALAFSSWAFLLLGGPVLIAYGIVYKAPWSFYPLLPAFFLGFILVPGSLGAIACLAIVNLLPRRRKQMLVLLAFLVLIPVVIWGYSLLTTVQNETLNRDAIQRLWGRFELAQAPLLPTHWVGWGVLCAARGQTERMLYYLGLIWSNGLALYLLTAWLSKKLYRRGFNRVATGGDLRRSWGGHWLDRLLERTLFLAGRQTRLLIVKDFRTFRRDPAQWAQVLIFCGLMALYLVNIRRLLVSEISWRYQNLISFLNVAAVALLLCTYTGRFIYPMLSLEGRKFWVLGLLPMPREKLLWGKFAFSATGSLLIALTLVLVSDLMLAMPLMIILLHALSVVVLAAGLSGLSVGLGAIIPNFRETDPSKIAAGFGGTLNLVIGLGYLIVVTVLMALPWHLLATTEGEVKSPIALVGIAFGVLLGLTVGAAAVIIPLGIGARRLRQMEF
jgi:ABC-2 type transport system permease protein